MSAATSGEKSAAAKSREVVLCTGWLAALGQTRFEFPLTGVNRPGNELFFER